MTSTVYEPFHLPRSASGGVVRALIDLAAPMLERILAFPGLNEVYARSQQRALGDTFCDRVLATLGIRVDVPEAQLRRIPATGGLVVVANHPIGGIEGLILASLLRRIRPDAKLLANYLLHCIPELRDQFIFVDPFGGSAATRHNVGPLREAAHWLKEGGCLGVFPAGEVAHLTLRSKHVTDPPWSDTVARLVRQAEVPVVPVYFHGRNRWRFQLLGLIHPRLRTLMLPREFLHRRAQTLHVRVGTPIPFERISDVSDSKLLTQYLRLRTYVLRSHVETTAARSHAAPSPQARRWPEVEPERPTDQLRAEVERLPASDLLLSSNAFAVYASPAERIPSVLHEIGRKRELTFRGVGEGSGKPLDIDRFDADYLHLFLWNQERHELVGAYRMARTDDILTRRGVHGLYTHTLFSFDAQLIERMGPALELGRSFVVPEYQRHHSPLMLLWKGIGRYVAQHPRYRMLFGAVSISDDYHSYTKQLLAEFLKASDFQCPLSVMVSPRNPPRLRAMSDCDSRTVRSVVRSLDDVDELVREIEGDGKLMPVLLRQYLKLNAKLLGLNRDPDFGDVVDGLMLVDLTKVELGVLRRYLGNPGAAEFLARHGVPAVLEG